MEAILTTQLPKTLQKRKKGSYRIKKLDHTNVVVGSVLLSCFLVFLYFIFVMCEYKWDQVRPDLIWELLSSFFQFQTMEASVMIDILGSLVNTILLAFVTTILGAIIGLFLGLMAARNLSNPILSNIIRGIAGFIRAVPTIIWVLLFVSGFGLTATTAIVGMSFHSIAYFIKSYSEAFEEVDSGTMEALRATGASWWQIVLNAVLPVSFTKMISWVSMRCEMNFAAAVIIGPAVGVPGTIGSFLNQFSRGGNYASMGFCIICIFLTALCFELCIIKYKQGTIINA